MTFNVAMGLAFRKPFAGFIRSTFANNEHLRRFDVIGLQEACANDRTAIELFRGVMKRAHGRVYEHLVLADPKSRESCRKAQVILLRYPIVHSGGLRLPRESVPIARQRGLTCKIGADTLRVYNLHLSNRDGGDFAPERGRWTQGRIVLEHWLDAKKRDPRARGIVLGDFNSMGDLVRPGRRARSYAHDVCAPNHDAEPTPLHPDDARTIRRGLDLLERRPSSGEATSYRRCTPITSWSWRTTRFRTTPPSLAGPPITTRAGLRKAR